MNGTIKWYNPEKGYGFIATAGADVFIHAKQVKKARIAELNKGDQVDFNCIESEQGPRAENVTLIRRA